MGDHSTASTPNSNDVTTLASPPSTGIRAACAGLPPVLLRNAIVEPSDDHLGKESPGPAVNRSASNQIERSYRSSWRFGDETT